MILLAAARIVSLALLCLSLASSASCGSKSSSQDPWLEGLRLDSVSPGVVVPFTSVQVAGSHFVDTNLGASYLHLRGTFVEGDGNESSLDIRLGQISFVDFEHMQVLFAESSQRLFPAKDGVFRGSAWVEVVSEGDGKNYVSPRVETVIDFRSELNPLVIEAQSGSLVFVSDRVEVGGDGFFLGESEGRTWAELSGCFRVSASAECIGIAAREFPLSAASAFDRTKGFFQVGPSLAGIHGGVFEGELTLVNRRANGGAEIRSDAFPVIYDLLAPTLFSVSSEGVSLGQFLEVVGGGFVAPAQGDGSGGTELFLVGTFTPAGGEFTVPVDLLLLPEVLGSRRVRYVMNEDDALGRAIDLRRGTGRFTGALRLRVVYGTEEELGASLPISFSLDPVKQVVYLRFLPDYVNTLRHFGLRGVDREIRERVLQVVRRDYAGVNFEVRTEMPTDFALYSTVDIAGQDLNGLGLFGYDNTAGKDIGNVRLYDHIGGVNAVTQQDGYPGFGGVFIESMFAFSQHPKGRADSIASAGPLFDQIFDPFRPDTADGAPVRAADFSGGGLSVPTADPGCPSTDRSGQIRCAIWVMGNMVGTTVSHEIAHSLGLANPEVAGSFHNNSDEQNRIMDNGGDRPFTERAQLRGEGPGMFCRSAYDYLRSILPSTAPADYTGRESCF